MSDLRYAVSALLRAPRLSMLIVAMIALAIGSTAAVFSIFDQTLFRPAPFAHADRLVDVSSLNARRGSGGNVLSPAKIAGWQAQPSVFEQFEAYAPRQFDLTGTVEPERVRGLAISTGLLPMLGVSPQLGRGFVEGEGREGGRRVALISDALWRRRFGASGDVLGREMVLNDQPYTVIGIMPRRFRLLSKDESVWLPFDVRASASDTVTAGFHGVARLRQGLTADSAQVEADLVADHLQSVTPIPRSWYLGVQRKRVARVDPMARTALLALLGAVAFVLLTACANVATLYLTNTVRRAHEMAVRSALGASRSRLMRQVLLEGCLLVIAGGAFGALLATWGLDGLLALAPANLMSMSTTPVEVDRRVLIVTAMISLAAGLLSALIPALRASRPSLTSDLHGSPVMHGNRGSSTNAPSMLVAAEVAFSLVLLVGAALMIRTLVNLESQNPGVNPRNIVSMRIDLPMDRYSTVESRAAFFDDLSRRLRTLAGVEAVAGTWGVPNGGFTFGTMTVEGSTRSPEHVEMPSNMVTSDFFRLMGIQMVAGRDFQPDEMKDSVIVSRAMAQQLWPDASAVGRRFRIDKDPWQTVVGVVENIVAGREHDSAMHLYMTFPTRSEGPPRKLVPGRRSYDGRVVLVRANDPMTMVPAIKSQIWSLDKNQTIEDVRLVEDLYAAMFDRQRFVLWVMTVFAVVAVAMTAFGLFGVLSQTVVQRRREIGIRMAIGASSRDVLKLVVVRGIVLTFVGLAAGLAGAAGLSSVLTALLFEVSPYDPLSFAAVTVLFIVIAAAACWLPARAAMRIQPSSALRVE